MEVVEFRAFGSPVLHGGTGSGPAESLLAQPKRLALLAYLLLSRPRGFHRRDELLPLFWPESDQRAARGSLSQALYVLRRTLGQRVVVGRGSEEIGVDFSRVRCDVIAFEEALERGDPAEALSLYAGELLPAFFLAGCPAFERWLDAERERLRSLAIRTAVEYSDGEAIAGRTGAAVETLRRAAIWTPYSERIHADLVRLLLESGDRTGAHRSFQSFVRRVRDELEAEPSEAFLALEKELTRSGPPPPRSRPRGAAPDRNSPEPATAVVRPSSARPRIMSRVIVGIALLAVASLVLAIGVGSRTERQSHGARNPNERPRILVIPFESPLGADSLDLVGRLAADWIALGLAQTGVVDVLYPSSLLLALTGSDAQHDARSVEQLIVETDPAFVIRGSLYGDSGSVVLQAQVLEAPGGVIVRGIGPIVSHSGIRDGIEEIRKRTAGALSTVLDPRLASWAGATTQPPSLESYRIFAEGLSAFLAFEYETASRLLSEAHERDPEFSMPLIWLLFAEGSRSPRAPRSVLDSLLQQLEDRRDRLTPLELALTDYHAGHVYGDTARLVGGARRAARIAPGSEWEYKLGFACLNSGCYREGIRAMLRLRRRVGWIEEWGEESYWNVRMLLRHAAGDDQGVLADADSAEEVRPDILEGHRAAAYVGLGALDDARYAVERRDALRDSLGLSTDPFGIIGELYGHGHLDAARRLAREAAGRLRPENPAAASSPELEAYGRALCMADDWATAVPVLDELLRRDSINVEHLALRGVVAARSGDVASARRILARLADIEQQFRGRSLWWRARVHASLGEARRAVDLLGGVAFRPANALPHLPSSYDFLPIWDDPDFRRSRERME